MTIVAAILALILTLYLIAYLRKIRNPYFIHCIILGFLLRVGVMLIDLYTDIPVFGSGVDSEWYHEYAFQYMTSGFSALEDYNYDLLVGIIYVLTDASRLFAQYINVLFGIGIIICIIKILRILNVDVGRQKKVILLASLMPNLIINSAILLREAWIEFFLIYSLLWFVKWYVYNRGAFPFVYSILAVLLASWMHAGCIFVAVGYFIVFITYSHKAKCFKLNRSSLVAIMLFGLFFLIFMAYIEILGRKFAGLAEADPELLAEGFSDDSGGSTYLTWLPLSFSFLGILSLPIRMFYFAFSPIPFDWRGLNDIVAFLIDSAIYIWLFYHIYRDSAKDSYRKLLGKYLLLIIYMVIMVFSVGTNTAGTAMRHRAKIVPVVFVIYALYEKRNRSNAEAIKSVSL